MVSILETSCFANGSWKYETTCFAIWRRKKPTSCCSNFEATLPPLQSDLAKEITKDPYNFDFLCLTKGYQEKELENALTDNITKFLLELGNGFAFVGKQYKLIVGGDEFRIDLLFYHIKLKCYVVVELKATEFKPEFAGKLSFYTSAVDEEIKDKNDNPAIGILICKSKKIERVFSWCDFAVYSK